MSRFPACLAVTLGHEGGWSDHPDDPGGATMRGITQATYDAWRRAWGQEPRSVRGIEEAELRAIYRARFWSAVQADRLPAGLDLAVFDFAVNSGPGRAARALQRCAGATPDGVVGPRTLAAVAASRAGAAVLAECVCDRRLAFLRRLRTWPVFGRGWSRRVEHVRATARAMATEEDPR